MPAGASLIKHHSDPFDMLPQFCMVQMGEQGKVYLVGQQKVVELFGNRAELVSCEGVAVKGEIYVRPGLEVAFCP